MKISYSIDRITTWLGGISIYLAVQSILARRIQEWRENEPDVVNRVVRLVNINLERSIPTWYASMMLLLAAILVLVIGIAKRRHQDRYRWHWLGLAIIFTYLSIDEASAIHEEFTRPLRDLLGTGGVLYFAWVILGVIFAGTIGLLYIRFVFHLPPSTRNLVIGGAVLFLTGALVIESYSASLYEKTGTSLTYSAIATVEEALEMLGVVMFIHAMLLYIRAYVGEVHLVAEGSHEES